MRAAAPLLLILALLSGCAASPPEVRLRNETSADIAGEVILHLDPGGRGDTSQLVERWEFDVPAGAWRTLGTLPGEPQERYHVLVRLADGRSGGGRATNAPDAEHVEVRVGPGGIEVTQPTP